MLGPRSSHLIQILNGSAPALRVTESRAPSGDLFLYGTTTPVGRPGESWWDGERQALKQNDLVWARSRDGGRTWSRPSVIPMPIPGSAEAPGPLTVTRGGRWIAAYAPYNTFDPAVLVDR